MTVCLPDFVPLLRTDKEMVMGVFSSVVLDEMCTLSYAKEVYDSPAPNGPVFAIQVLQVMVEDMLVLFVPPEAEQSLHSTS